MVVILALGTLCCLAVAGLNLAAAWWLPQAKSAKSMRLVALLMFVFAVGISYAPPLVSLGCACVGIGAFTALAVALYRERQKQFK